MSTVPSYEPAEQPVSNQRFGVATKALGAGGGFAALIGGILYAAGASGFGVQVVRDALTTLCVLAALTMFTAAVVAGRP